VGRSLWREDGSVVYNCCWPSQRSHSRVRARWDSRPYFTVSDLRRLTSSPPTTRRVTVEVFDPASTRVSFQLQGDSCYIAAARTTQRKILLLRSADDTENTSHMIAKHCWDATSLRLSLPRSELCVYYLETPCNKYATLLFNSEDGGDISLRTVRSS
jgi:hypothetical protein